ncbi:hypothetical protein A0H81_02862 [Grifola frondosa]|uniref:Uncharacterized protein n=1 Tax=Grifola frondosa TaxID=5627 RepID=A0A1C7MKE9_GRIFR|nr:hypothetical protein A0H81_02862 [Grifola frondosa]
MLMDGYGSTECGTTLLSADARDRMSYGVPYAFVLITIGQLARVDPSIPKAFRRLDTRPALHPTMRLSSAPRHTAHALQPPVPVFIAPAGLVRPSRSTFLHANPFAFVPGAAGDIPPSLYEGFASGPSSGLQRPRPSSTISTRDSDDDSGEYSLGQYYASVGAGDMGDGMEKAAMDGAEGASRNNGIARGLGGGQRRMSRPVPSHTGMPYIPYRILLASSPNDTLALSNCLVVHPSDFPQGQHVLVKQAYPLMTRLRGSTQGGTGVSDHVVNQLRAKVHYGSIVDDLLRSGELFVDQVCMPLVSILLHGNVHNACRIQSDSMVLNCDFPRMSSVTSEIE